VKIKSQKDFWSGLAFFAIGVAFAWGATSYRLGDSASPGPGYFPFGLGLLLALLGGIILFTALTIEGPDGDPIEGLRVRPLVLLLASVVGFGYALPRLGLAVSLPLLVVVASLAGDEFRWRDALLAAVVLTVGSWALFDLLLKLDLPLWPSVLGYHS
jgi:hypothetical protein